MKNRDENKWPVPLDHDWHPKSASIVIDNYNYSRYVSQAIESAVSQTHRTQVIVVDDGSTDNSREIIQSYSDQIEAVFKTNGGHASAFNAGYARATGDIVLFLDSDDIIEPIAVETLLACWKPETAVAHYPMTIIDAGSKPKGRIPDPFSPLASGDVRGPLLKAGYFPSTVTSGMAFSRQVLAQIMPVPEEDFFQGADGYLLRAAAFFGPYQYVDALLSRYRIHDMSDSNPLGKRRPAVEGYRHRIKLERNFLKTTKDYAARFQLPVSTRLGDGSHTYIGARFFSLILDPANHPIRSDHRFPLFLRYVSISWRQELDFKRRVIQIFVAVVSLFGGKKAADTMIRMAGNPATRPGWFRRISSLRKNQGNGSTVNDS